MRFLEKISEFVGKWMAVVVLVIAALSLFIPKSTLWIELGWVNYLLMVVMFGMAQAERFCARICATERNHYRMCGAVHCDADACVFALQDFWARCCADGGRRSCGHMPGRDI